MPKAKPFSDGDEEERTTIESQWEDEASTTVEQGDVADKIKSLGVERRGNTNLTHTGAMDEPTVDDQHAPVLSAITPLRVDQNARLSITQGNDTGQTFEIRPGKTYTIGRAIDNDVVLTDIAVSRKHFDLRHEDGAWVIVDHGSGNGTVVNGNVEDNPFMLANGDMIEIGNTVFRFEQEKGPVRNQQQTIDLPEEEEELSTVAGKPLRADLVDVEPAPTPVVARHQRPKTLPPPMPVRSIGASQPPPLGLPPPQPASTLPLPQMANRPPMASPGMPTMLGDPQGRPLPGMPPQNGMPTTIPGQPAPPRPSYPYPQAQASEIPPHSVHAQMLLVQSQNRRGDASTAHVPPMSYDPMLGALAPPPQRYTPPQLSTRAKYILGGAGLAILAAIATIGIVKSGSAKPKPTAAESSNAGSAAAKKKSGPTVEAIKPEAPKKGPTIEAINTKAIAKAEAPKQQPWKDDPPKQEPPKQEPPKQEIKQEPKKQEPAKVEPPKQEIKQEPKKQEPPKVEPPKVEPPKQEAKQEPKKQEPKQEPKKAEARIEPKKREPKASTSPTPAPKKVAAAVDTSGAKAKADDLYKRKKFNDASSVLVAAAKSADDDEAKELNTKAEYYSKLGKALNQGTAPATEPIIAFENLRKASNYDKNVGNFYEQDISTKLAQVAPKAAFSYLAKKNYQQARTAVLEAERYGNSDGVAIVRQKLESVARDLYESAKSDGFETNNSKEKLKQIKIIVDSKSPWYQKAQKALGG